MNRIDYGDSKWLKRTSPDDRVSKIARRALTLRLRQVWITAHPAAKKPYRDIENIHRLRVATRRATAALQIFRQLVPRKRAQKLKLQIRAVRRAAGEARDLDVLRQRIETDEVAACEIRSVLRYLRDERKRAQKPVVQVYNQMRRQSFQKKSKQITKRIRWRAKNGEPTFSQAVPQILNPLLDDFFRTSTKDLDNIEALHEMRIRGKRIRYALEIVAGAFNSKFRKDLYPIFRRVQERLGTINDHSVALTRFRELLRYVGSELEHSEMNRIIVIEEQKLCQASREFRSWWNDERAFDLRRQFDAFFN